ncbi:protein ROOT INITIATION DEFECTIVE 3-like [Hibiscus syriacus]|uniref:Mechanosensitive ion channel protein n=1 Tax=Hibiscus syriacus TaxID=106335 RepID=A0A6A3AFJ8_HIBSY|nr:protein ROOT INITIATION DEFECTIVE 3-like [Hibiscus syriacus]
MTVDTADNRKETILKIDDNSNNGSIPVLATATCGGKIRRESSYDFLKDGAKIDINWKKEDADMNSGSSNSGSNSTRESEGFDFMQSKQGAMEDPPSKLIGQFLHNQKASGEISLDIDLDMDELQQQPHGHYRGSLPTVAESPSPSAAAIPSNPVRKRQGKGSPSMGKEVNDEVVKCSSNSSIERRECGSFQRKSNLLAATKTKSRLIDPPTPEKGEPKFARAGMRSEFLGKHVDEEEDDPLLEEDLLDVYKKDKLSVLVLLEWLSLITIIAALVCSLTIRYLREKRLWHLMLWKWEVLVLVLICGRLVSEMLWVVKTLLVKVLASSFHVSTYFDRIQDSLFNQYVIETLFGPPLIEIQRAEEEDRLANEVMSLQRACAEIPSGLRTSTLSSPPSARSIGSGRILKSPRVKSPMLSPVLSSENDDMGIRIDHLHKLNHKNVSAWNMKRLINIVRHGALSTLDEQIQDSTHGDESANQIRNEYEAKVAARKIFQNVTKPGSSFIYLEDIERFLQEDEALKAMSFFEDASESRRISKKALKNWVVNAFRERRAFALTLNDTKTTVNRLHRVVDVLVGIIIVVIWLLILEIATGKVLVFISSQLLLVAFVFGNTCKTLFEAIIFLFVMHPFDVGDRCENDGIQAKEIILQLPQEYTPILENTLFSKRRLQISQTYKKTSQGKMFAQF